MNRLSSASRRMATLTALEGFAAPATTAGKRVTGAVTSTTLKSGIKVVSKESNSGNVSLIFGILAGAKNETPSSKGAAHFLSTCAFAGAGETSGLRIVRELENHGATLTSTADREVITYGLTVPSEHLESVVGLVATAIQESPSRTYVFEEMKPSEAIHYDLFEADITANLNDAIHEAAFGENTPLGSSLFSSNFDELDVLAVKTFRDEHFKPSNIVVAATGVSHDTLTKVIESAFSKLPSSGASAPVPSPYIGGEVKIKKAGGVTHIALAFPVPPGSAAEPYAVLYSHLAAKIAALGVPKGSLSPFFNQYSTGGLIGFYAIGSASLAASNLEAAVAELKAASKSFPESAKVKLSLQTVSAIEGDSCSPSSVLLSSTIKGIKTDLRSVSASAVAAAAGVLLKSKPSFAVIGATAGAPSLSSITSILSK